MVIINLSLKTEENMAPWIREKYVTIGKDNKPYYIMHYKHGKWVYSDVNTLDKIFEYVNSITKSTIPTNISNFDFSTLTIFKPDSTVFENIRHKYSVRELKLAKLLNNSLNIKFDGNKIEKFDIVADSFKMTNFIENKILNFEFEMLFNPIENGVVVNTEHKLKFLVYYGYSKDDFSINTDGSVNLLDTTEGLHIESIRRSILRTLSEYSKILTPDECKGGMRLFVLCMSTFPPNYNGQTKEKLTGIPGFKKDDTYNYVKDIINKHLSENKNYFDFIIGRLIEYKKSIGNLTVKELIQKEVIMGDDKRSRGLGKKIVECTTTDREKAVLFICEGDSALGSLLSARNSQTHAILP